MAASLATPWHTLRAAGLAVAGCGVLGVVYSVIVIRRAHRQSVYQPVLEDWIWHTILPPLAYAALFVAGAVLRRSSADALFVIGAAVLLLVFIGIHNAWDTVTYMAVQLRAQEPETEAGAEAETGADAGAETRAEAARGSGPGSSSGPKSKENAP